MKTHMRGDEVYLKGTPSTNALFICELCGLVKSLGLEDTNAFLKKDRFPRCPCSTDKYKKAINTYLVLHPQQFIH